MLRSDVQETGVPGAAGLQVVRADDAKGHGFTA